MTEAAKELSAKARKLSPAERLELVDDRWSLCFLRSCRPCLRSSRLCLLASLDEPDAQIDRLWAKEADERLAAYRRGEIKAVPLQEVLAKYRVK